MISSVALLPLLLPSALCGFLNGFFGSGGGIPMVFALEKQRTGASKFRITLSLTFWLCLLSAAVSFSKYEFRFSYLWLFLMSAIGGFCGCRLLFRLKSVLVNRLFAILLFCSGIGMIWRSFS